MYDDTYKGRAPWIVNSESSKESDTSSVVEENVEPKETEEELKNVDNKNQQEKK